MSNELHFTVKTGALKAMGYGFQKLFADNYICYSKNVGRHKIRLWSKGKTIEVDCWQCGTKAVIDFYKQNRDNPIFDEDGIVMGNKRSMKIQLNPATGEVKAFDWALYNGIFKDGDWTQWEEKYAEWHTEIYIKKEDMDLLIQEIELLTA